MKIRDGFVSNSSSSSFVIASKKEASKLVVTKKVPLENMIRYSISHKEELKNYYKEEYSIHRQYDRVHDKMVDLDISTQKKFEAALDSDYGNKLEEYKKYLELIKKGYIVHIGSASSDNYGVEALICEEGIEEHQLSVHDVLIDGEGGY